MVPANGHFQLHKAGLIFLAYLMLSGTEADGSFQPRCLSEFDPLPSKTSNMNFCFGRKGGLVISTVCEDNQYLNINNCSVDLPYRSFSLTEPSCKISETTNIFYEKTVKDTCLQNTKEIFQPLIQSYSGRTQKQIDAIDEAEFAEYMEDKAMLPEYSWIHCDTSCISKKVKIDQLYLDICSNEEHTGTHKALIDFQPGVRYNVTHSSCSCAVSSNGNNAKEQTIEVRALDVRFKNSLSSLYIEGSHGSRLLDRSELFYWPMDGYFEASLKHLYLELRNLHSNSLPYTVLLEITGTNLTVSCGPTNIPGTHNKQASEAKPLGTSIIIVIVVVVILVLLVLTLVVVKFTCKRNRQRKDSMLDDNCDGITMDSQDDIEDRPRQKALHRSKSLPEEAVTFSMPSKPLDPVEEESNSPLLANNVYETAFDKGRSNNNNKGQQPESPPIPDPPTDHELRLDQQPLTPPPGSSPPLPDPPNDHELKLMKQISYIDEYEDDLAVPSQPSENIYNHLNERKRPDVVPDNIYDTTASGEGMYSSPSRAKADSAKKPKVEGIYDV